jgi:hypothetical protein
LQIEQDPFRKDLLVITTEFVDDVDPIARGLLDLGQHAAYRLPTCANRDDATLLQLRRQLLVLRHDRRLCCETVFKPFGAGLAQRL